MNRQQIAQVGLVLGNLLLERRGLTAKGYDPSQPRVPQSAAISDTVKSVSSVVIGYRDDLTTKATVPEMRRLLRQRLDSARRLYQRMKAESGRSDKVTLEGIPRPLRWLIQSLLDAIGEWWEDLAAHDMTLNEWVNVMWDALAEYHLAGFMAGNGSENVSDRALDEIATQVGVQLDYLKGFKVELQSQREYEAGAKARAESYAAAIKVPYWTGNTNVLPLPAMPAQGTQCQNNCKCKWRVVTLDEPAGNYDAYWERHADDSCQTCVEREQQWSPVRIRDGILE